MSLMFGGSWISYHATAIPEETAPADLASGRRLTYAELAERAERAGHAAGTLRDSLGPAAATGSRCCPGTARRPSRPATGTSPRQPPRPSRAAGCAPETSPSPARTAASASPAGPGTCTSAAGRTATRPGWKQRSTIIAVAEVAVAGVPGQRWGETGAARIVLAPGTRAASGEIRSWAREHSAAFKVPRDIHIVAALPRNATGKVIKAGLRRQAAAGAAAGRPGRR